MYKIKTYTYQRILITNLTFFIVGLISFLIYVCQLKTMTTLDGIKVTKPISKNPIYVSFAFVIVSMIISFTLLGIKSAKLNTVLLYFSFSLFVLDILFSVWMPHKCPDNREYNEQLNICALKIKENLTLSNKFVGINVAGFDQGGDAESGYACIADAQIDWLVEDSSMNILRLPVLPPRILKELPTKDTTYNVNLFTSAWTLGDDDKNPCNRDNGYYPPAPYMAGVMTGLKAGAKVIIDAHDNDKHLATFGPTMTPENFVSMWRLIATYILENVPVNLQPNVIYELYNEPVGDIVGTTDDWYSKYTLPAINIIRDVFKDSEFVPIIIATTFGNWSGMHSWVDDGSLQKLIDSLQDISSPETVWIAGHQYCDSNYSGVADPGCDPSAFTKNKYKDWMTKTNETLGKFSWFLTEGNVRCPEMSCPNASLYIDFLKYIIQDPKCLGFTVWMSNTGADYQGTLMGTGSDSTKKWFQTYSQNGLYETNQDKTIKEKNNKNEITKYTIIVTTKVHITFLNEGNKLNFDIIKKNISLTCMT